MFLIDPEVLLFKSKYNFNHDDYLPAKARICNVVEKLRPISAIREMFNPDLVRRISK